jgi:hypothetical protein
MRALRRPQARRNLYEQWIAQYIPEPHERMTDRRLRKEKTSRRPGELALVVQDFKDPQQVEIDVNHERS